MSPYRDLPAAQQLPAARWSRRVLGLLLLVVTPGSSGCRASFSIAAPSSRDGKAFRPRLVESAPHGTCCRVGVDYVATSVVLRSERCSGRRWSISSLSIEADGVRFPSFQLHPLPISKTYLAMKNSLILGAATASCAAPRSRIGWVAVARSRLRFYLDQVRCFLSPCRPWSWRWVSCGYTSISRRCRSTHVGNSPPGLCHALPPIRVRAGSAALRQLHSELEDAARMTAPVGARRCAGSSFADAPTLIGSGHCSSS